MIRIAFRLLKEEGYNNINKISFEKYLQQSSSVTITEMNEIENTYDFKGFHFHLFSNYSQTMNSLILLPKQNNQNKDDNHNNNQQIFSKEKFIFSCIDYLFEYHFEELSQNKQNNKQTIN
jgi:hypothetical protein